MLIMTFIFELTLKKKATLWGFELRTFHITLSFSLGLLQLHLVYDEFFVSCDLGGFSEEGFL